MNVYRRKPRKRKSDKAASKADKCITKWCRNKRAVRVEKVRLKCGKVKTYTCRNKLCWKCKSRKLLASRPVTYVLNMLRISAKRRKIDFSLTVPQFTDFCARTGYLERRGQEPASMTIDRINPNEGYHIWNIRVLSHAENSAQGVNNTPREERAAQAYQDSADDPGCYQGCEPVDDEQPF